MPSLSPMLAVALQAAGLLLCFTGAGLYLRGFWVYFRALWWLRQPPQQPLRQRYRSSTLAAVFHAPDLRPARRQLISAAFGVGLFVLGGTLFKLAQA